MMLKTSIFLVLFAVAVSSDRITNKFNKIGTYERKYILIIQ